MNKEEKEKIIKQLITKNKQFDFGRKKLQKAQIVNIHNDFVSKRQNISLVIKKQEYVKNIQRILKLFVMQLIDDLYLISYNLLKEKYSGNKYACLFYCNQDLFFLLSKYPKYNENKLKQFLIVSYTICEMIVEVKNVR